MLNIELADYPVFKYFIGVLKAVNEEVQLILNETGMSVRSMDPAHVMMVDASTQQVKISGEERKISLNVVELWKFLDRLEKDEEVALSVDDEKNRLIIKGKKGGRSRRFEMPLLDNEDDFVPQPKIFFKSRVALTFPAFERAVKDAQLVAEHLRIHVDDKKFVIKGAGDSGEAYAEWEKGSDDLIELKIEEEVDSTYTLSYINQLINAAKGGSERVNIEASTDMPVKIELISSKCEIAFYLAPCIGA